MRLASLCLWESWVGQLERAGQAPGYHDEEEDIVQLLEALHMDSQSTGMSDAEGDG